ncbi:TDP-4-oxo-6-deoxy-D-glucose transaminase [Alcanivorax sp. S71-1-4]|nr:TDP-4-oxo-6-deoxy-D-glucose transaminase [Alcanivorax sp. S71-1-4]
MLLNSPEHVARAEVLLDKGTNRKLHQAGSIAQYSWVDLGLSAPPSAMQAACLLAQLEESTSLLQRYRAVWSTWHAALADTEQAGLLRRPHLPPDIQHNGHIYAVLLPDAAKREALASALQALGIQTARHYYPLHLSEAGRRLGRSAGSLRQAEDINERLLRLPVYPELPSWLPEQVTRLVKQVFSDAV